ncbi:MAG: Gfo/Idh/MocA family protein [Neisseriaceae bacterium]|jgi:UDP-N-acetyl-2-amino-2-deoxyglucuronate dehydrogenase
MHKYKIAVIGCGAIFSRHLQAIKNNQEHYKLIGLYDADKNKLQQLTTELNVKAYKDEDELFNDEEINCVAVITPSHVHYEQMRRALINNKNVIVEKPATFLSSELDDIEQLAKKNNVNVFTILQVRLNPSLIAVKEFIQSGLFGKIRNVSLVQRWQRPLEYFTGWRGGMSSGGGVLREFSIHYLDALLLLVGAPNKVSNANFYKTKFMSGDVFDTIYAHLDFGGFGGNIEISIGAEPRNLECSLSIMSENGFIKLGGKSLDEIIEMQFLDSRLIDKLKTYEDEALKNRSVSLASTGASPYHPELYRQIILNPDSFRLRQTYDVVKLIENIYSFA